MRIEMEEAVRRGQTDELAVLGAAGVSDEEFESEFRVFIGRNLLLGALLPAAIVGVAKAVRAASQLVDVQAGPPL